MAEYQGRIVEDEELQVKLQQEMERNENVEKPRLEKERKTLADMQVGDWSYFNFS